MPKPNRVYREIKSRKSYSNRKYIRAIPQFESFFTRGKLTKDPQRIYDVAMVGRMYISIKCINAISRMLHRFLSLRMKVEDYKFLRRAHAHECQRENKVPTGAGADRVSQGMRQAFGKVDRVAVRMKQNKITLITLKTIRPLKLTELRELEKRFRSMVSGSIKIVEGDHLINDLSF